MRSRGTLRPRRTFSKNGITSSRRSGPPKETRRKASYGIKDQSPNTRYQTMTNDEIRMTNAGGKTTLIGHSCFPSPRRHVPFQHRLQLIHEVAHVFEAAIDARK